MRKKIMKVLNPVLVVTGWAAFFLTTLTYFDAYSLKVAFKVLARALPFALIF